MSRRVCFIGDSHVAALRLAISSGKFDAGSNEIAIFGAIRHTLSTLVLKDGKLVSDEKSVKKSLTLTGGQDFIDLDSYDVFGIVACGTNLRPPTMVTDLCTSIEFNLPERQQLVSEELLDAMVVNGYRQTLAYALVELVASATDKPIYLLPDPLWTKTVLEHTRGNMLRRLLKVMDGKAYADWAFRNLEVAFEPKAAVVRQPEDTIRRGVFTKEDYGKGSVHLINEDNAHEDDDFAHMNGDFGAIILDAFFKQVDAAEAPGPQPAA